MYINTGDRILNIAVIGESCLRCIYVVPVEYIIRWLKHHKHCFFLGWIE